MKVHLACPDNEGYLASRAQDLGADVRPWAATRNPGPSVASEIRALRKLALSVAPDVVHLHSAKAGLAGRVALRRRVPTVFQPHSWSFHAATGRMRWATVRWERIGARWADVIIAVSEDERAEGEREGVRARYFINPNGIDLAAFAEARAFRAKRGSGESAPTVVCVGRLCEQKGQDLLLAAWPRVRQAVPNARLVFVGEGPARPELEATAASVEGVEFVGDQESVAPWLAMADVVAFPSRWEAGISLAVMEAMAVGCSIVLTRVAGGGELPAGVGKVVAAGDTGALGEALIERLAAPETAKLEGAQGGEFADAHFGIERVGERALRAYEDALGNSGTPNAILRGRSA